MGENSESAKLQLERKHRKQAEWSIVEGELRVSGQLPRISEMPASVGANRRHARLRIAGPEQRIIVHNFAVFL